MTSNYWFQLSDLIKYFARLLRYAYLGCNTAKMDVTVSPQALQTPGRKNVSANSLKDVWLVVREGSLNDVETALALLKKNGIDINSRNAFGLTPLHIATWRNHIPIFKRLLAAGVDPDARVWKNFLL